MNKSLLLLLSIFVNTSCKTLYDLKNYVKAPVSGAINGVEWKYGYGYTDPEAKLPDGIEYMIVLTTLKPANACPKQSDKVPDPREIAIGIDGKIGEMTIGAKSGQYETSNDAFTYNRPTRSGSVAFVDPSKPQSKQYQFATSGKIRITKVTKDSIEGMALAKIGPENFINGKFKVKICKWGQLN